MNPIARMANRAHVECDLPLEACKLLADHIFTLGYMQSQPHRQAYDIFVKTLANTLIYVMLKENKSYDGITYVVDVLHQALQEELQAYSAAKAERQ